MNQSFDVTTIIFAALAIFIVWKLRSVLGTRTGEERPPFNPFLRRGQPNPNATGQETGRVIALPNAAAPPAAVAEPDPRRWHGVTDSGNAAAIAGLDAIAAADPTFNARDFMQGARAAYEMIVAAFSKGDRNELKGLVAPDVLDSFTSAIKARENRGETVQHTFVALDKALVEDASLQGRTASVTLLFESQQINAVRNKDGGLAEAGSDVLGQVIDHWTFARDVSARDPNWLLVGTHAG